MTNIKNLVKVVSATATVLALSPLSVLAQQSDRFDFKNDIDKAKYGGIVDLKPSDYLRNGINLLLGVAGVIAFIFLLWGGIQWIVAGGDKEGTEKARKKITAALVGLAIVFSAYALIFIIQTLFGVNLFIFDLVPLKS